MSAHRAPRQAKLFSAVPLLTTHSTPGCLCYLFEPTVETVPLVVTEIFPSPHDFCLSFCLWLDQAEIGQAPKSNCRKRTHTAQRDERRSDFSGEKSDRPATFGIGPTFFVFFAFSRGQLRFSGLRGVFIIDSSFRLVVYPMTLRLATSLHWPTRLSGSREWLREGVVINLQSAGSLHPLAVPRPALSARHRTF